MKYLINKSEILEAFEHKDLVDANNDPDDLFSVENAGMAAVSIGLPALVVASNQGGFKQRKSK